MSERSEASVDRDFDDAESSESTWREMARQAFLPAVSIIALVLAIIAIRKLLRETDYDAVLDALLGMAPWRLAAALALTAVSFGALSLYDLNGFRALGQPLPWRRIAPGALAAYAVAQTAGFGPLSGGAVRLRFYTPLGVAPGDVARLVVFVTLSFGFGLLFTGSFAAVFAAPQVAAAVRVPISTVWFAAMAGLVVIALLVAFAGRRPPLPASLGARTLPERGVVVSQLAITALDVAAAAGVLWVLLPAGTISFHGFLPLFAVAIGLGILSHVPAGIGVFEAVLLAALHGKAPVADLLAAFALYRLIYHALPLGLAAITISVAEMRSLRVQGPAAAMVDAAGVLAPQVLAAYSLVLGAMLVFSGVTPARGIDLEWLAAFLPLPILESAHFLASSLGFVLMVSARGLAFRLNAAWWVTMLTAAAAFAFSLVKAIAVFEAMALTLLMLALVATRREFTRPSALLQFRLTKGWIVAMAAVLISAITILFFVYGYAEFGIDSLLRFETEGEAPRGLRALIGGGLLAGVVAIWSLMRPAHAPWHEAPPTEEELEQAMAIAERNTAVTAKFVGMGDKRILLSENGEGFIMYGRQGASWIALFDPAGPVELWPEMIWSFCEAARAAGGRVAFYEVSPERLSLYADAGLQFFKVGEEARVDLEAFDLKGGSRSSHRNVLNKGSKEGWRVEIVGRGAAEGIFDTLQGISDGWLAARKATEKGFSLGAFERDWVLGQRIALLYVNEEIAAFATLLETAAGEEVMVDLMRHRESAPRMAMEFLFLKLCVLLKEEGRLWFGLGMAPLSGLGESEAAPAWQKIGRAVYEHGLRSYNFKGLRTFKSGFRPEWRPRYLAVGPGANPALVLLDATRLINFSKREKS